MTPAQVADRLGLSARSGAWSGDCPACSYARCFTLKAGAGDTVRAFCANGCNRADLMNAVERAAGSGWQPTSATEAETVAAAREKKQAAALRLWSGSEPAAGTPADAYLTWRGLPGLAASRALRFRSDCPHPDKSKRLAIVAAVVNVSGAIIGAHRTYLARDGRGKAGDPPRASLGPVWGGAVRLDPLDPARPLVIGEGIETAASAGRLAGLPAWAALSAGNMAKGLVLPPEARRVVIAVDPDPPGEQAAQAAALRWQAEGREVHLARPDGAGDFNDVLAAREATHGR